MSNDLLFNLKKHIVEFREKVPCLLDDSIINSGDGSCHKLPIYQLETLKNDLEIIIDLFNAVAIIENYQSSNSSKASD